MARIERATSPLPRECSTTEPHGPADPWPCGPPIDRLQFEKGSIGALVELERETGIEPASLAWKARVLPLNYSRAALPNQLALTRYHNPGTTNITQCIRPFGTGTGRLTSAPAPRPSDKSNIEQKRPKNLVDEAGFEPA